MRLNHDCVRDILLAVESTTTFNKFFDYPNLYEELKGYSSDQIMYHIRQMNLSGLLYQVRFHSDGVFVVDLSPQGHEFLGNIRSEGVWKETKNVASKLGGVSLQILIAIAGEVGKEMVKKYFGG